jgi:Cu/Ag efflux protein CusF
VKKLLGALGALAILTTASLAMAATATGTIKSVDAKTMMIALDNGTNYHVAKSINLSKLKVGEKVAVTFETKNGVNEASAVKAQ